MRSGMREREKRREMRRDPSGAPRIQGERDGGGMLLFFASCFHTLPRKSRFGYFLLVNGFIAKSSEIGQT